MLLPPPAVSTACPVFAKSLDALKDHLFKAPLPVWLDVLHRTDADDHLDLIAWMICQPECDLTLAQVAFYRCRPRLALRRVPGRSSALCATANLCEVIVARCHDGAYPHRVLGLRPEEMTRQVMILDAFYRTLPAKERAFDVPAGFLTEPDLAPSVVPLEWSVDGSQKIWSLFDAAGLRVPQDTAVMRYQADTTNTKILTSFTQRMRRSRPMRS